MFGMFSFAFWGIRALKCEAVNFPKFELAGIPVRPFEYLDTPILIIAQAPCMCMCDAHAHHDVTRFTYDANHVTMTSPAFAFHLCHTHDIQTMVNDRQAYMQLRGTWDIKSIYTHHFDIF